MFVVLFYWLTGRLLCLYWQPLSTKHSVTKDAYRRWRIRAIHPIKRSSSSAALEKVIEIIEAENIPERSESSRLFIIIWIMRTDKQEKTAFKLCSLLFMKKKVVYFVKTTAGGLFISIDILTLFKASMRPWDHGLLTRLRHLRSRNSISKIKPSFTDTYCSPQNHENYLFKTTDFHFKMFHNKGSWLYEYNIRQQKSSADKHLKVEWKIAGGDVIRSRSASSSVSKLVRYNSLRTLR